MRDSSNKIFTKPDGSPSITAGSKCAFMNMIFAKYEKGWTHATKTLAVTYFDLSEKKGHAFARRKYLRFRTKASLDTISSANEVIEASGLFSFKYRANNSLLVFPNLEAIEAAYEKYVADHEAFKRSDDERWNPDDEFNLGDVDDALSQPHQDPSSENSSGVAGEFAERSRNFREGSSGNPSRNPSTDALDRSARKKPSKFHTGSDEPAKPGAAPFGKGRPSGGPAGNELERFIAELHTILPSHEPFGDHRKPFDSERSHRGELFRLRALIRAGWKKDEVREMVETYVKVASDEASCAGASYEPCFKTLSSIFAELESKTEDPTPCEGDDEFYGRRLPKRLLRKPQHERTSANDNRRRPDGKASGDWDDLGF